MFREANKRVYIACFFLCVSVCIWQMSYCHSSFLVRSPSVGLSSEEVCVIGCRSDTAASDQISCVFIAQTVEMRQINSLPLNLIVVHFLSFIQHCGMYPVRMSKHDSGHWVLILSRCPSKDKPPVREDGGAAEGQ